MTTTWDLTRNGILEQAFRRATILALGQTMTGDMISDGNTVLNAVLKDKENEGSRPWRTKEYLVALTASSRVTSGGVKYTAIRKHTSTATDEPGVGGLWEHFWQPAMTDEAAGAWALGQSYTSAGHITLSADIMGVQDLSIRMQDNQRDYPVPLLMQPDYRLLSDRATVQANQPSFAVMLGAFPLEIVLYPHPFLHTDYTLNFLADYRIDDCLTASANPNPLSSWNLTLIYEVASYLADSWGVPEAIRDRLKARAEQLNRKASGASLKTVTSRRIKPAM